MNKSEMARRLAERTSLSGPEAAEAVDAIFGMDGAIAAALAGGESVSIVGFGAFEPRRREARTARNPATGEPVSVAARTVPSFKPSRSLRDRVDG